MTIQKIILFLSLSFSAQLTWAYVGAVSTATGGTGRAAVEPVDGLLLNPAFVSDLPSKNFSFNYSPDEWALVVSDNGKEAFFPAGLQMVNTKVDTLQTQKLGLSFAAPRFKKFVIGATASMVGYDYSPATNTEQKFHQGMLDLGITFAITRDWGLGVVATKVGSSNVDLPKALQIQRKIAAGLSYTYGNFVRFRFDAESDADNKTDRINYMAGMETYVNDWVVVRLGYQLNRVLLKNYFSGGLGFTGPQFGLHYAYISDVVDKTDQKHLIDLAIPF